ncbi:unnamed protein product [Fasciola hepatica]|uniref:Uncharacterized protein n=1 Tax=Fasciola hepatica TaxID=6192 RepID=A0ABC9HFX4_FASHE
MNWLDPVYCKFNVYRKSSGRFVYWSVCYSQISNLHGQESGNTPVNKLKENKKIGYFLPRLLVKGQATSTSIFGLCFRKI